MKVTKSIEFDAGHRVARHGGQCRNIHGHRYRVLLTVEGNMKTDDSSEHGMVIDFGRIKAFLTEHVHDQFDHGFIVDYNDADLRGAFGRSSIFDDMKIIPVPYVPTAEGLARAIAISATEHLSPMHVAAVTVYETPTSYATWEPDSQ